MDATNGEAMKRARNTFNAILSVLLVGVVISVTGCTPIFLFIGSAAYEGYVVWNSGEAKNIVLLISIRPTGQ